MLEARLADWRRTVAKATRRPHGSPPLLPSMEEAAQKPASTVRLHRPLSADVRLHWLAKQTTDGREMLTRGVDHAHAS